MGKRIVSLVFLAVAAPLGFSQTGSGGNGCTGATCVSTGANANNQTVVYGGGGGMAQAVPGVMGTLFPGPFPENGERKLFWNNLISVADKKTMEEQRSKHGKITRTFEKDAVSANDRPVRLLWWDIFASASAHWYTDDRLVYTGILKGGYHEPIRATLLALEYDAKKRTHTDRCAAYEWVEKDAHTSGFAVGPGAAVGGIVGPGTNNTSLAGAAGGMIGTITVKERDYHTIELDCLNVGPFEPPPQKEASPTPPTPTTPAPPETPTTPPPAPAPQPQPEAQAPTTPPPPPTPPAPETLPVPAPAPIDECNIPELTINFYFDRADIAPDKVPIKDEYGSKMKSLATWLKHHQTCKVQIQGHASTEGSNTHNVILADNRAGTIYDLFLSYGVQKDQLEHASLGKYFPRHDYNAKNRRVILVVQGPASGK